MPNWSMAEFSSPHEARVKTSSQTAVKPSAQSIIIFGGATFLIPVAVDFKIGFIYGHHLCAYILQHRSVLEEFLDFALQLIAECDGRL